MQPHAPHQDLRGLALLMRQGMAAWMRRVGQHCACAPTPRVGSQEARPAQRLSVIEQMLVNIVAAMALSNVVEEVNA